MKLKIKNNDLIKDIIGDSKIYPKYATQIINLANQNAQGTRPRIVGQLSELIIPFQGKDYADWENWYLTNKQECLEQASEKIYEMIINLKEVINKIDKQMVDDWVKDLVLVKTFVGLSFQKSILKKISELKKTTYKMADSVDEAKGIDGYIGEIPVSIKPISYKTKNMLREKISVTMIYYTKDKNGITIEFENPEL